MRRSNTAFQKVFANKRLLASICPQAFVHKRLLTSVCPQAFVHKLLLNVYETQSQSLKFLFRKEIYIEHQNILTDKHNQDWLTGN